jgi:hypothetical protein
VFPLSGPRRVFFKSIAQVRLSTRFTPSNPPCNALCKGLMTISFKKKSREELEDDAIPSLIPVHQAHGWAPPWATPIQPLHALHARTSRLIVASALALPVPPPPPPRLAHLAHMDLP